LIAVTTRRAHAAGACRVGTAGRHQRKSRNVSADFAHFTESGDVAFATRRYCDIGFHLRKTLVPQTLGDAKNSWHAGCSFESELFQGEGAARALMNHA